MVKRKFDLVVVGAGSAGTAAATHCAKRGLRVALLEARPLAESGARWVNAVPGWTFDDAQISRPEGDELLGVGSTVHLVAGARKVVTRYDDLLEVEMPSLVARLQREAQGAGAVLFEETHAERWDGAQLHTSAGSFAPRWIVDASGFGTGARLLSQPRTCAVDICSAAQQVHPVADPAGAKAFYARHGAQDGDAISLMGVAGGFSTLGLRVEGESVGILTGSIPAAGHASGPELMKRFLRDNSWIGVRSYGGSRAIPLGRPHDLLASERVAIIGDAARQVFSAHGSGVGHGLIAARLLADALTSPAGIRGYGVTYQRRYGGAMAAFDLFRRFSQTLTTSDLEALIEARLLSPQMVRLGLSQGAELPALLALLRAGAGALTHPALGSRLAAVIAKMGLLLALYAAYPRQEHRLPAWTRRVERLFSGR